jgi:hypothetical protein
MPVTEPGPVGTCFAYPAQPVPTRSVAGPAIAVGDGAAAPLLVLLEAAVEESFEHAARLKMATALKPAAAIFVR